MAFNKNELLLDRVRSLVFNDIETKKMLLRLTSLEDPSLGTSAEGEEIVDAIGAPITTLYRAKRATFSATNSLVSLDLAAAQYGSEKEVASETKKIIDRTYEIKKVEGTTVKLDHVPAKEVLWIYAIENNEIGTAYGAGAEASATEFVIGEDGTITLPTSVTTGKIYVEYEYETSEGVIVRNLASKFPETGELVIYAYFRDVCNDNLIYSGKVISPRAKLNPENVELALTSTGKHPFEFTMNKEYCSEEGEDDLFYIIVTP